MMKSWPHDSRISKEKAFRINAIDAKKMKREEGRALIQ